MKLTPDALIAKQKWSAIFWNGRPENDKAQFLGTAGYTIVHADQLADDIRTQLLPVEAMFEETTDYGKKYRISEH